MPTHAEIADKLLMDAAALFKNMGKNNPNVAQQMNENARVFEQVANLLATDPDGKIDDKTHGELAARLLEDAANFFRGLGEKNPPLAEQMNINADIYESIAALVSTDPLGIIE